MIVITKKNDDESCALEPCSAPCLYKFTDIKIKKSKKKRKIKHITLGYACIDHVNKVGKMLGRFKDD